MFFEKLHSLRHTLALRLTIWYAAIFAVTSFLAFGLAYLLFVHFIQERTDDDLRQDLGEFGAFLQAGGLDQVKGGIALESKAAASGEVFYRVWGGSGTPLVVAGQPWPDGETARGIAAASESGREPMLRTIDIPGQEHRTRVIVGSIGPGVVMEIGQSLEEDQEFIDAFLKGFLLPLGAVIALGGPIGWFMARRALRGVQAMTRTASEIAEGALDRRVAVGSRGDELDMLARTFNTMLDRIQALIVGMREVTDNLAHDFRSPLARIRTSAEMTLAGGGTQAEWELMAAHTTEECDRLMEMIDTTLDIAEAESGAARLRITDLDLSAMVNDACDVFRTVAEDAHIEIAMDLPARCPIAGDRHRLQRVVANLLDNALKYTAPGGRVAIRLVDEGPLVRLSVADTGIGVPADELGRIFRRFYRGDRSRSDRGNGLGLSLALAFVRAHGGDISVVSAPGKGSTFTVVLARSREGR